MWLGSGTRIDFLVVLQISERIDAAMSDASDPNYRATLEILKRASEESSGGISEFIGAGTGSTYGYGYKSTSYGY